MNSESSKQGEKARTSSKTEVLSLHFDDGSIKSVPYAPNKNFEQFLQGICTQRIISMADVIIRDEKSKRKIRWNSSTTFADLKTHSIMVVDSTKASHKSDMVEHDISHVDDLSGELSDAGSSEGSSTTEKSPRKEQKGKKKEKIESDSSIPDEPPIIGDKFAKFYFSPEESKTILYDPKKSVREQLEKLSRDRGFKLENVKLVNHETREKLEYNDKTVFGDFRNIRSFGIVEISEKEKGDAKKRKKKAGEKVEKKNPKRKPRLSSHRNVDFSEDEEKSTEESLGDKESEKSDKHVSFGPSVSSDISSHESIIIVVTDTSEVNEPTSQKPNKNNNVSENNSGNQVYYKDDKLSESVDGGTHRYVEVDEMKSSQCPNWCPRCTIL